MTLEEFTMRLHAIGVRLTGSRAVGAEHAESDYDFRATEKQWPRVVALMREADPSFESCIIGHVGTRKFGVQIEISTHFWRKSSRLPTVDAFGLWWRTW